MSNLRGIFWLVLDNDSVEMIEREVKKEFPLGRPHHVTLVYGADKDEFDDILGRPVTFKVTSICWDARVQALTVVLPTWLNCDNEVPHLTISYADGASPVEANDIFNKPRHEEIEYNRTLKGTLEFHCW